jgi:flagellar L-ring protein FlgH
MTAIGTGLAAEAQLPPAFQGQQQASVATRSMWDERGGDLFRDARAVRVGDLVTVVIAINDSATLGNTTDRSRESSFTNGFDAAISMPTYAGKTNGSADATAASSTKGQGNIGRSEKIQLSVAAVVTEVLPNGNLLISGSQEVRVNFELRELTVSGIVRPRDVSRDNTITYDKVAEARISYGGRGRLTEVQQPSLVHQILDLVKPF